MAKRIGFFLYGLVVYVVFLATFLYTIGFIGNYRIPLGSGWVFVPKGMDTGAGGPFWQALGVDLLLLAIFAIQHSGMARRGFKKRWTRIVPWPVERSTYVLASSIALIVLFYFWRPIGGLVWDVQGAAARWTLVGVSLLGWGTLLLCTFLINHFELFGLQQTYFSLKGREPSGPRFVTPFLYKVVRHPLYLGFVIAFWATPKMTVGHLVFSIAATGYILMAIQFEERDLIRLFGERYREYRRKVRMLVPLPRPAKSGRGLEPGA